MNDLDPVECTSCGSESADSRQKCHECRNPVCMMCACYDEEGDLYCRECIEDVAPLPALGGRFG